MKETKHLWLDTETLSFDQTKPDIIQMAGLIEINGKLVDKFNYFVKPMVYKDVEPGIWEFHETHLGITEKQIMEFPNSRIVYEKLIKKLNQYVDKFDKNDKFVLCGYNVLFDKNKLTSWFEGNGDKYLFSYLKGNQLDVFHILSFLLDDLNLPSFKLENVWKYMVQTGVVDDIKGTNHSAVTDIQQTYLLWKNICIPALDAFKNSIK